MAPPFLHLARLSSQGTAADIPIWQWDRNQVAEVFERHPALLGFRPALRRHLASLPPGGRGPVLVFCSFCNNDYKLDALRPPKFIVSRFWKPESEIRVFARPCSLRGLQPGTLCLFQCLVAVGLWPYHSGLSLCPHVAFCVYSSSSLTRTPGFRAPSPAPPFPDDPISRSLT